MNAERVFRRYANPWDAQSINSSDLPQNLTIDEWDAAREFIVGRVSGPLRFVSETKGDTVAKVAKYTRYVLFRDETGGLIMRRYSPECGQHWQDIKDLGMTPAELARQEPNLHWVDEDDGEGFNDAVEKGRHEKASTTQWFKNKPTKICVKGSRVKA